MPALPPVSQPVLQADGVQLRVRGPVEPGWLTTVLRAVEALGC